MAFKIVKQMKKPDDKLWSGSCKNCKSEVECLRSDLGNHVSATQRDGAFSWEICPVCDAGRANKGFGGLLMYPKEQS